MSVHYDLTCKKCDSSLGVRARNSIDVMQWLRNNAKTLSAAHLVFEDAPHQIEISIRVWNAGPLDCVWLGIHHDHGLVITDEYGEEYP